MRWHGILSLCIGLAAAHVYPRIVGGAVALWDQYPFVARLYLEKTDGTGESCTGQFTTDETVLTAAHCCKEAQEIYIFYGQRLVRSNTYRIHPEYVPDRLFRADLCVVSADEPVTGVAHVAIATRYPTPHWPYLALGYGVTADDETRPSTELRVVALTAAPKEECNRVIAAGGEGNNVHVCAGLNEPGEDTCYGDSGGPYGEEEGGVFVIYGITSFGINACGAEEAPAVFVNVAHYREWILDGVYTPNKSNATRLGPGLGMAIFVFCCPVIFYGAVDYNARGFDANVVVIDEAAYVAEDLLIRTILPVSDQAFSCLLMISTPGDEKNYYSELMKKRRADGEPVFKSVLVTHMCDNCRDLPINQAVHCNHWRFLLPMRKMGDNEKDSLALHDGRLEDVMRERFAIICGDTSALFPDAIVDRCFGKGVPRFRVDYPPSVIYIGCDPGMHKSDTGLVAMGNFPEGPRIVALGLFRNDEGPPQQKEQIQTFFRAIWSNPNYKDAPIVFIPEGAPAQEAYHLTSHLQLFVDEGRKLLVMRECAGDRLGVPIDHNRKRSLVFAARALLSYDSLRCTRDMISITNKPMVLEERLVDNAQDFVIGMLAKQLKAMHVRVKPLHEGVDERTFITGKGFNQNDDLAMAFMTMVYWSTHFMVSSRPLYNTFKEKYIGTQTTLYRDDPMREPPKRPLEEMTGVGLPIAKRRYTSNA